MASIQEVVNAAYLIGKSAKEATARSVVCADSLKSHSSQLAATVKGSHSGEYAVRQVQQAERAVRDSAVRLTTLQSTINTFIQDLIK